MGALVSVIQITLGRLSPGLIAQIAAFLSRSAGRAIVGVRGIVDYARTNPVQSLIVAEAVARYAGSEAAPIVQAIEQNRVNLPALAENAIAKLQELMTSAARNADSDNMGLNADVNDTARDIARIRMGRVLKRAFGSLDQAREVQVALDTLKSDDFAWLSTVSGEFTR